MNKWYLGAEPCPDYQLGLEFPKETTHNIKIMNEEISFEGAVLWKYVTSSMS